MIANQTTAGQDNAFDSQGIIIYYIYIYRISNIRDQQRKRERERERPGIGIPYVPI